MTSRERITPSAFFRAVFVYTKTIKPEQYVVSYMIACLDNIIDTQSRVNPRAYARAQLRGYAQGRWSSSDYKIRPATDAIIRGMHINSDARSIAAPEATN